MPILRTIVDIEVPDSLTKGEATAFAGKLRDFAGVVLGPELTEKTTEELNVTQGHHIHNGINRSCRYCSLLPDDGKS